VLSITAAVDPENIGHMTVSVLWQLKTATSKPVTTTVNI